MPNTRRPDVSRAVWSTGNIGSARLSVRDQTQAHIDAGGGRGGIAITRGRRRVDLRSVDSEPQPTAGEHYVCDDEYHVNYPQHDANYALRLAWDVVPGLIDDAVVIEMRVSVQTDLMNTHPTLDLAVDHPSAERPPRPCDAISRFGDQSDAAILLGPHDRPHTQNRGGRLRLFGDFLERGVIRRARPWIVWGRTLSDAELRRIHRALCQSPVPLTP